MSDPTDTSGNAVPNDANAVAEAVGNDDASKVAESINSEQAGQAEWLYAEGVKGVGEKPAYFKADKYGTLADQAKAYQDLEGKFGAFTGSPEEYTPAELSEELKEAGIEIAEDDPLLEKALAFAKESNMNQEGFNQMINLYAETMAADDMALETLRAEEMKALGNNAQVRIDNLNAWATKNLSSEMVEGFQSLAQNAASVQTLERLVAMTRSAPISNDNTKPGGITADEVKSMQFEKDEHGNRRINTDKEFGKRYREAANQLYGTENHSIIVGG